MNLTASTPESDLLYLTMVKQKNNTNKKLHSKLLKKKLEKKRRAKETTKQRLKEISSNSNKQN
ncbi:MAG: hypothetical protein ACI837_002343 [Crocinitomicaceae bacterium]|jgi:hypothetical protein